MSEDSRALSEQIMQQVAAEVAVCTRCMLHHSRKRSVPGEGPVDAQIMFIGEGPGFHENEQGRPFVGAAGKFLEELLASIGMRREQVFIGNVVKCRPPNNRDPLPDELAACSGYLDRQIQAHQSQGDRHPGALLNGALSAQCQDQRGSRAGLFKLKAG